MKNICIQEKNDTFVNFFNPGLALTDFQTTRPWLQQVSLLWARDPKKTCTWSADNFRKTRDLDKL